MANDVRRLLTVGHSYVVEQNRQLAREMAICGAGRWEITVAAPGFMHGDLRPISLESRGDEPYRLAPLKAYGTRRVHTMRYERGLRKLLRAQPWDLVHAWEEPYVLPGFQIAYHLPASTPLVFWSAQNIAKRYPPPFSWFERYVVGRADGWLACGKTTLETLAARLSYAAKPHCILPLGVDLNVFRADSTAAADVRRELDWSDDGPPIIGYSGRFIAEKGVEVLRKSLAECQAPWRALFLGGGPLEAELRAWAAQYADRVRVVTNVPHDRVPRYLAAMDVLAAPSLTMPRWREQLGRMLLEAMACAVPVVGSDSAEIPHVIGDAGVVVPEGNVAALCHALDQLLTDRDRRRTLGALGLARVQTEYSWQGIARRHLEFFDELLERRTSSRLLAR